MTGDAAVVGTNVLSSWSFHALKTCRIGSFERVGLLARASRGQRVPAVGLGDMSNLYDQLLSGRAMPIVNSTSLRKLVISIWPNAPCRHWPVQSISLNLACCRRGLFGTWPSWQRPSQGPSLTWTTLQQARPPPNNNKHPPF